MKSMYLAKKKKREVDPNAPPRPTLLGHEKEMKTWRAQFTDLAAKDLRQEMYIKSLERKINRLESRVDAITSMLNRLTRR